MKKNSLMNARAYVLGAAVVIALLALFAGLYAVQVIRTLRMELEAVQTRLVQSEESRVSDLHALQKELGSLLAEGTSDGDPSEEFCRGPAGRGNRERAGPGGQHLRWMQRPLLHL